MYEFWMFFVTGLGYLAGIVMLVWAFRFSAFVLKTQTVREQAARIRRYRSYKQQVDEYLRLELVLKPGDGNTTWMPTEKWMEQITTLLATDPEKGEK